MKPSLLLLFHPFWNVFLVFDQLSKYCSKNHYSHILIHLSAHGCPISPSSSRVSRDKDLIVYFSDSFLSSEQSTLHTKMWDDNLPSVPSPSACCIQHGAKTLREKAEQSQEPAKEVTLYVDLCNKFLISCFLFHYIFIFPRLLKAWNLAAFLSFSRQLPPQCSWEDGAQAMSSF